jgi:hypothetical protein
MKRTAATSSLSLLVLILLSVFARPASAQQAQAMCRETLEAWVRDKSMNARWNSDHTAVIMVRGGVEYVCTCPDQNRPPVCKPASSAASGAPGLKATPPAPPPAYPTARPVKVPALPNFAGDKEKLLREIEASGLFATDVESERAALLGSLGDLPPADRAGVEAAVRELAVGAPATVEAIREDIAGSVDPRSLEVAGIVRDVKASRVRPLGRRFDNLRIGDVLLCRQPDDMLSAGFYTSGWIIIIDKTLTGSFRARASHTFLYVREVNGVKLFLDNMPGQGTRIKSETQIAAEYRNVGLDVARPLSDVDAGLLWQAAREVGIKSVNEFAKRSGNAIDTTDYGIFGEGEMVCSETSRWALMTAGLAIPETRSALKKYVGRIDYGPSDFYVETTRFLVTPIEWLPAGDAK